MTTQSPHIGVETAEDSPRILTLNWEKTDPFEPRYGAGDAAWVVQSWGRSRCADELALALRADDPKADVTREDVSTAAGDAAPPPGDNGSEHRYVLFIDETPPADPAADGAWAWAHAVIHTCRHVASHPGARLWIVTRTGLHGPGRGDVPRPDHDFAWAIGRCHAAESPDSWGGLVDIAVDDPREGGRMLAAYLLSGSPEDEVLLHADGPFTARLTASMLPPPASGPGVSMDRLHIVSGGVLGLSFEIERWLARSGARRLLILGRTPLDDDRKRNLRRLETLGCTVDYEILDVGDAEKVRALTARLRGEAIGGVFHLASHWQVDGRSCVASFQSATSDQTRVLLGAKADGALLLGELAEELQAEALVLFSSAAATLGSPGQANYAAANAVLDGVARRLHGGPVRPVSIAWGPIGEVGFGATSEGAGLHESWERIGLRRLTVDQVLSTVGMALSQDEPNIAVVTWDESALAALPWFRQRPALERLAAVEPVGLSLERLAELGDAGRVPFIVEVIRGNLAAMLGEDPEDVDPDRPLLDLGIDSLIALELLFVVDREFAVRLELHEVLADSDATLTMTAEKLDERLRAADRPVAESDLQ